MIGRPLNADEREILDFLLLPDFEGRSELVLQAATALYGGSSCDCGCPSFWLIPDLSLAPARTDEVVVTETEGLDPGGNHVGVLLFIDFDGYLKEIEVYSLGGDDFAGLPHPQALAPARPHSVQ